MEFLKDNNDILFEISKYLSLTNLKNLKLALPELKIKDLFLQKKEKYPTTTGKEYFADFANVINKIYQLNYQDFLIHNLKKEKINHQEIVSFDIDYLETDRVIKPYIIDLAVEDDQIRINNLNYWRSYILVKHFKKHQRLSNELINSLIAVNQLESFINQYLEVFSDLKYYIKKHESGKLFLSDELTLIVWRYLPQKNRIMLRNQLVKFFKLKTFENLSKSAKIFLKENINQLN